MSAPSTFERVYAAIKHRLISGGLRPGERLEPHLLSDDFNSSVTPVRDALHRLVGERLVEAPRHEGFRTPLVSELTLRWLYAWHRDLLLLALASRSVPLSAGEAEALIASEHVSADNRFVFVRLVEASGNPEHAQAFQSLVERLGPFAAWEGTLLDGLEEESAAIAAAATHPDRRVLRRLVIAYHRRRARIVPELVAAASRTAGSDDRQ